MDRREAVSKNVWSRLDKNTTLYGPRDRVRYHPYQRGRESDHSNREIDQSWSRITSGHSDWINPKKKLHHLGHPLDSQRFSRTSPRRRGSHDTQRTLTENYVGHNYSGYNRDRSRVLPLNNREWGPVRHSHRVEESKSSEAGASGEEEAVRRRIEKGKGIAVDPPPVVE